MFEVNLLNKTGLQTKEVGLEECNSSANVDDGNLSEVNNDTSDSSGYYYLVLIIFCLFLYIYYFNQTRFNQNYENIYPSNILSLMQVNDVNNNISSIKIEGDYFSVINSYDDSYLGYNHQAYFDSLFDIRSFLSISELNNNLFLEFNWYILEDDSWSLNDLFEKISSNKTLSLKIDFLNNKIISVADYDELIILFELISSFGAEHVFKYQIESKGKYYKIIISEYD